MTTDPERPTRASRRPPASPDAAPTPDDAPARGSRPPASGDATTRGDEDVLVEFVEAALSAIEAGGKPDLAHICRAAPHLAAAVAEAVGLDPERAGAGARFPAVSPREAPLTGRVLGGRYELQECIGIGAMGAVYAARDPRLDRRVAVKVMHSGLFPDASRQARFEREAKVLAALQVPTVVPIHDHGRTDDGLFFLVMDLLAGVSMAAVLHRAVDQDLDPHAENWAEPFAIETGERTYLRQVVTWALHLARGLDAAHGATVIHRDVKPSNVFLTDDGRAVLLDFGIAAREGDAALTAADSTLGTPWYMAPEQATSKKTVQPTVDVYGLGATLYHMLTKRPPHEGDPVEVIRKLATEDPAPPHRLEPALPRDLCAIIEKALDRDPGRRYPSMQALAGDLAAFLDHRPVTARPLSRAARFVRRVRRRPARAVAIATVTLLLPAVLLSVWLFRVNRAASRADEHDRVLATVPALICLEGYPDKRLAENLEESGQAVALLTRLLELQPDDIGSRMMRGALHLDRGERGPAVADFRTIHAQRPTPYTAALLAAYEHADDSAQGAAAIELRNLPEPAVDVDWLIAGFHTLRARKDYDKAAAQLDRAAADYLPARDLRLLAWLMLADRERRPASRRVAFERVRDEAFTLEGIYGRKTARTRHAIGAALVALRRYSQAIGPLEDSLRLRPNRHGPLHNLGIAYRRLGQREKAEQLLRRAHELRPWLWNTLMTLSQLQCDLGRFDQALEFAEKIPATGTMGEAWKRPLLIARVHLNHAFHLLRAGELGPAKRPAAAAVVAFRESLAKGCRQRGAAEVEADLAKSIADGEMDTASFLALWRSDFRNPIQLQNLEVLLAGTRTVTPDTVFWLRVYLLRLASDLSPDDPDPRARLGELIQKGK